MYRAKNIFSILFLGSFLFIFSGCEKKPITIPDSPVFQKYTYASPLSKKIVDRVSLVKTVVADTLVTLAPGVTQTTLNYLDYSDKPMRLFILEVDLNNPRIKIKAGTPNNANTYGRQTVTDIAIRSDAPNNRVIAAVNGDYFNPTTGEPQSILYKNGVAIKPVSALCALCTFLSIDKQGNPMIVSKDMTIDPTTIQDAVGGFHWLIRNGQRVTQGDPSIEPRTAVGVTTDKKVYFVVIDGRLATYSNGMNFGQLSHVFFALGVKDAINMDGGGSSTLVVKEGAGWAIKNRPSDGVPRTVANAWLIVDTQ
ncbi:MAG TPA: phosphodiester glycosidase family protein [Flavisolibacter sp.]|nr:phosphodiester glycosidase family protein [Flavisolibacter sp.]